jgi:hypothetical protein
VSTAGQMGSLREALSDQLTRRCCIDRLSWHGLSECGPRATKSHIPRMPFLGTWEIGVRMLGCFCYPSPQMESYFNVGDLSAEQLLAEWRWLCPAPVSIIARNAFGDLFLRTECGTVSKLDVSAGQIREIAETVDQFLLVAGTAEKRREWFAEDDARAAVQLGIVPGAAECIGFKMPLCFRESSMTLDNMYVADLYEYVRFLGDIHRQMATLPDGAKVRLRVID